MKKLKQIAFIVIAVPVIVVFLCYGGGIATYVVVCGVIRYNEIARIDIGNDRFVTVYSDICWEAQTGIYYEVSEAGQVVVPKTFADYYADTPQFQFNVAYAGNQSLVMLYDQATGYDKDLAIIIDFKTHDSWPVSWLTSGESYNEAKKKALTFFEQLQRENPSLYRPSSLAPSRAEDSFLLYTQTSIIPTRSAQA